MKYRNMVHSNALGFWPYPKKISGTIAINFVQHAKIKCGLFNLWLRVGLWYTAEHKVAKHILA